MKSNGKLSKTGIVSTNTVLLSRKNDVSSIH